MEIQDYLFFYIIVIMSAILHEYAHAWTAFRQGDLTAKYAGRLTLNPIPHIDIFGTVIMPLFLLLSFGIFFGYAKPVPINPYNFKDQRRGMIYVSLAGVGANFLVAIILGFFIRLMPDFSLNIFLGYVVMVNIWLGLFNLLPFPPLDGSKLLMAAIDHRGGNSGVARIVNLVNAPFGIIIALFVAMFFLPYLSNFIFRLIIGG